MKESKELFLAGVRVPKKEISVTRHKDKMLGGARTHENFLGVIEKNIAD
jgi:hypothetical protein